MLWPAPIHRYPPPIIASEVAIIGASTRPVSGSAEQGNPTRGVHKLRRLPDPADLQQDRIGAPHALLDLRLRLGEASGAALALPLIGLAARLQ